MNLNDNFFPSIFNLVRWWWHQMPDQMNMEHNELMRVAEEPFFIFWICVCVCGWVIIWFRFFFRFCFNHPLNRSYTHTNWYWKSPDCIFLQHGGDERFPMMMIPLAVINHYSPCPLVLSPTIVSIVWFYLISLIAFNNIHWHYIPIHSFIHPSITLPPTHPGNHSSIHPSIQSFIYLYTLLYPIFITVPLELEFDVYT